ncbi:hypothetical protein CI109_104587 [Kwoniella shandongensis]|uniref:Uncharacterized protein n=1 Tax=Kwoniella shandongensis TaxID=1734106 RepID=A0A5M6BVK2_9TREE|nr:uncharacterized protein CI109_005523 [Kwoniella shandongensis]KAA5526090.1 hypothetical protein CI109_005523 [Kwoniella shandongensis]
MSLPSNGSTAPTITSPFLAWPSKPIARDSPLSPPSTSKFDEPSTSYPSFYDSPTKSNGTMERRQSSSKGKERATDTPELRVMGELEDGEQSQRRDRKYAPPNKPLQPHQLGRIAQSFGIVIPHLSRLPSPTSPSSSSRPLSPSSATSPSMASLNKGRLSPLLSASAPTRPTPYLLSVIPPLTLLPTASTSTSEQNHQRERKWRRGRLLPLQPTLGSMLVCIAREYGLPSTVGLGVYLVLPSTLASGRGGGSSSSAVSDYSSEDGEPSGPQISSSTWSTLFSSHLMPSHNNTTITSRSSTPSHTPEKRSGQLGRDISFPPSPLSLLQAKAQGSGHKPKVRSLSTEPSPSKPPILSHSAHPSTSSSSNVPPTPASVGALSFSATASTPNPIVGSIEFDIDLDEATWFEEWKRSGKQSRHKRSMTAEGGMKQLNLVRKQQDERPRFLKELDVNRPTPEPERFSGKGGNETVSASASFYGFTDTDAGAEETAASSDDHHGEDQTMVDEVVSLLKAEGVTQEDLLASPATVSIEDVDADTAGNAVNPAVRKVQAILDKRGSGIVMSEQLDDLEKIMRQLSPRDIRLTSPRLLTPRMAAKVANVNLTLPEVPKRGSSKHPSSPLAGGFTAPAPVAFPKPPKGPAPPPIETAPVQKARALEDAAELDPRPVWPAVPFRSPGSPSSVHEFFARPPPTQRNVSSPASISSETQKRMQAESEAASSTTTKASEWVPRRPARPPSPKLDHQRTLSHTLSPELVDLLRSPPAANATSPNGAPISPPAVTEDRERRQRTRSGSMSLKGLRHQMSAKNLGQMWKNDKDAIPLPTQSSRGETVGLFKGGVDVEKSSFPGLREGQTSQRSVSGPTPISASPRTTEFGAIHENAIHVEASSRNSSLPGKSGKFTSKIFHPSFGFGSRKHEDATRSVSAGGGEKVDRGSKMSRRNPSHDGSIQISGPIMSTFEHKIGSFTTASSTLPSTGEISPPSSAQANGMRPPPPPSAPGHTRTLSHQGVSVPLQQPSSPRVTPASPHSPGGKSVRRKPVPGVGMDDGQEAMMKSSMSLGSMASFVLEDAPKGRRGLGLGL